MKSSTMKKSAMKIKSQDGKAKSLKSTVFAVVLMSLSLSVQAGESEIRAVLAEAKSTTKQAAQQDFEWTTTGPLIKASEQALATGEVKAAERLAGLALEQARQSLVQAEYAKAHWQDGIPH